VGRVTLRLYGTLNDFLPRESRQRDVVRDAPLPCSVKDLLESSGVPHPEIGLILIDGVPVGFEAPVPAGARIAAYPTLVRLDASALPALRPALPSPPAFVLDGHLGTLARRLRLAGFDALYENHADDEALAERAARGGRVLLTRDVELLKRRVVEFGAFVRATERAAQFVEVVERFDLAPHMRPFTRCPRCNGMLRVATPNEVTARVPERVRQRGGPFMVCASCGHPYWEGSHTARIRQKMGTLIFCMRRATDSGASS